MVQTNDQSAAMRKHSLLIQIDDALIYRATLFM